MILAEPLKGPHITLRTAEPRDAEFVLSLRLDPTLNQFLKPVDPSVENQRKWIEAKRHVVDDYHLIISSNNGQSYGVIAIYQIKPDSFNWGRWILSKDTPFYIAFESMGLVYKFAFFSLRKKYTNFEIRRKNLRVVEFHKLYGAQIIKEDETFVYFSFTKHQFINCGKFSRIIKSRNPN